ncbi:hypothetical protein L4D09_17060 [Photobacterium makurazakiensis]|uniref:hypothetical protein n=1 Tax=Photobacterium makurazakiensis TaxID=2910234 RepID=UPI003D0E46EC
MKVFNTAVIVGLSLSSIFSHATLVSIDNCIGTTANGQTVTCEITDSPASSITENPNNNELIAWDHVKKHALTENLKVDNTFSPSFSD